MAGEQDEIKIRPEIQALDAFIQAAVARLLRSSTRITDVGDGLLFLGNWHDAMPRLIFQDPVLQPVDTRIWGVIKIAAAGTGPAAFPTYKQIARTANVGSEATVARSMAILRATRWLSLCHRVRDAQGRFRGNIYALHDEPLPLADALYLDEAYVEFLEQAQTHAHPQVRRVAAAALGTIAEDLRTGEGGMDTRHPLYRRREAVQTLQGQAGRYFGFSSRQLQNLKPVSEPTVLQNLKSDPLQKLKSPPCSSSCYINKKTTTTTTTPGVPEKTEAPVPVAAGTRDTLAYPPMLTANEHRLARICLRNAPDSLQQDILDELAGRLLAARRKSAPIDNPIGYLVQLCLAARKGAFTLTSLGLKNRERRCQDAYLQSLEAAIRARAPSKPEPAPRTSGAGDGTAITPATGPLEDPHASRKPRR